MLSHSSGALAALLGLAVLMRRATLHDLRWQERLGLSVYAASLFVTFTASSLFHYFPWSPEELVFFKKLDHASIFVVIAATCTVLLNAGRSQHRGLLIGACWLVSMAALVLKMAVWPMALWMTAMVYLSVGWITAASVLTALRDVAWSDLRLLVYGMVVHSGAAAVFAAEAPVLWPGVIEGHELFHAMVLVGTVMHFLFVARYCATVRTVPAGVPDSRAISLAAGPPGS